VVGGGVWARGRDLELELSVAAVQDTLAFVRGPHTRAVHMPVTTGGRPGSVTIFVDSRRHRWLVRCENLAPNAPNEAYQLWFVTDAGVRRAELMPMDTDEPMITVLEMPREGPPVRGAAMTVEPRAGSTEPRGPTVFRRLL
ncbi:MAG: anti-sigma factor, partial [Candidatus Rokuibacteriota bacterium]